MQEDDLRHLALAIHQGDARAIDDFIVCAQQEVRCFLALRTADPEAVDPLCQQTFVRAIRALAEAVPEQPLLPWLRGLALRCVQDDHAERAGAAADDGDALDHALDALAAKHCDTRIDRDEVALANAYLERLSQRSRNLLTKMHGTGEDLEEMAHQFSMDLASTASTLFKLRSNYAKRLQENPA